GQLLNTNADTIASALSVAMSELYETTLIYCFEKNGVLSDVEDEYSVIETITTAQFDKLKTQGVIYEGMVPKLQNAFDAIHKGVKEVFIGNANNLHLFQQQKFGTRLVNIKYTTIMSKVTIIGSGNIGFSLAKGLVKSNLYRPADITLTRRT